ncbi:MAG: nitroreductase [Bacteroidia bacterium]|nr:nitroreductase [Bacteroidia bacterium]
MDIKSVIVNRRAVYPTLFSGEEVESNVIDKMLELANWAPTHKNSEPWRFKVYSKKAKNRLLDQCKHCYIQETNGETFNHHKVKKIEERKTSVSHIIAICMERNEHLLPEFEEIASVAMAVQNMWLYLASTQKYGGYWSTPNYALGEEFSGFLNLAKDERCLGLFYIGTIKKDILLPKGVRGDWQEKVDYHF